MIRKRISRCLSDILDCQKIVIDLNMDGLPLFKSSKTQLWPILAKIVNINNVSVFPIGIYLGKRKQESMVTEQRKFKFNEENGVIVSAVTSEYFLSVVCLNNYCAITHTNYSIFD